MTREIEKSSCGHPRVYWVEDSRETLPSGSGQITHIVGHCIICAEIKEAVAAETRRCAEMYREDMGALRNQMQQAGERARVGALREAADVYLENRLWRAFMAGAAACQATIPVLTARVKPKGDR